MKKRSILRSTWQYIPNPSLKMKLTLILTIVSLFQIHAHTYAQNKKFSIRMSDVTIEQVVNFIESNSDFKFLINRNDVDLNRKVSIQVENEPIKKILDSLFRGTTVEFEVLKKQIVLRKGREDRRSASSTLQTSISPPIQYQVNGKVTDSEGVPLPGANIVEKGTTNGTTADFDGDFSISVADGNAILEVSYIGFATKEILLNNRTNLTITLAESAAGLDEVVVVGYGTQKRSDVTGSVASVKGEAISKQGTVNASQALQGQVPGVTVVNTSGNPGAGASILIRGQGSYGDIDPLFVVDGAITDGINFINPNDIESIEVLKDASAAAIYGSRAANGVVLVTTKRGKSGRPEITFTTNFGIQNLAHKLDFATSQEWRDKEVWKYQNEGLEIPLNLQTENFNSSISTDWQDVLFSSAQQQSYNLAFSGGGENNNFNFSLGYIDQEGILVDSGYDRVNLRANSDFKVGRFKIGESFSINRTTSASIVPTSFESWPAPVLAPEDGDGNYLVIGSDWGLDPSPTLAIGNPYANIKLTDQENSEVFIASNVYGQYEIFKGLNFKTSASVSWRNIYEKTFIPDYTVSYLTNPVADLSEVRSDDYTLLWENTLNYNRTFGNHQISAVVGWTRQSSQFKSTILNAEGFPSGISEADAATTILPSSGGQRIRESLESYLGRINYSYKDKYQFTATLRQDASSLLIKELRKGTFPSFSLGWVVSEESFFPKNDFIDRLKFRGGYGELGRLNAISPYQVQNTLAFGGANIDYILGSGQNFANGITQAELTNPYILWERAQSTNIAIEANLFGSKLSFTGEYFIRNTKDLQFDSPIPLTVGTNETNILVNAGDIENKGWEFTLGYRESIGDFYFNVVGNVFTLKNKVIEFNNPDDAFIGGQYGFAGQDATRAEVGRELSNFWLLRTDGIFKTQTEINEHSRDGQLIQPNAQPGDLRFKDINDDGVINDSDKQFIDGSIPNFEYGFNLNASYKNFDFGLIFQGVVGQKIFNGVGRALEPILKDQGTDYWRPDNPNAKFFRPSVSDPNGNKGSNDFYLEDAGYLRLKNIQLGYTFPTNMTSSLGIENLRLHLTGQNILTFTKFTGYDPENSGFGLDRGVNTNVFPLSKTLLLGLTVNF